MSDKGGIVDGMQKNFVLVDSVRIKDIKNHCLFVLDVFWKQERELIADLL